MGPFPSSYNNKYILVAVDYMMKRVEAKATPMSDDKVVPKLSEEEYFLSFRYSSNHHKRRWISLL